METLNLLQYALAGSIGLVGVILALVAAKIFTTDKSLYKRYQKSSKSVRASLAGEVPTFSHGFRKVDTNAGLAKDKEGQLRSQGAISEEAISALLH